MTDSIPQPEVWCWEEWGSYPHTYTCTLPDGHDGPHEFVSDDQISVTFPSGDA